MKEIKKNNKTQIQIIIKSRIGGGHVFPLSYNPVHFIGKLTNL